MTTGVPLLDEVLSAQIGGSADFALLNRDRNDAVVAAVDVAEQIVGERRVVWVENGPASTFCLVQPAPGTVVVSKRAVELSGLLREVLLSEIVGGVVREVANQTFFDVAAEQALLAGRVEPAVKAIAMASIDRGVHLGLGEIEVLKNAPMSLGYLATWCYGLLHEYGHLAPPLDATHPIASNGFLLNSLSWLSESWMDSPAHEMGDPCHRAESRAASSVVGVDRLRDEISADVFAALSLLRLAQTAMANTGKAAEWSSLIREVHTAQQIVVVFDRLRRAATLDGARHVTKDDVIELALQPLAMGVRSLALQEFLAGAMAIQEGDRSEPIGRDQLDANREFVHDCLRPMEKRYALIEGELSAVTEFMLINEAKTDQWQLLEHLAATLESAATSDPSLAGFVELADGLGETSYALEAVRRLVAHPDEPLSPVEGGEMAVVVPWVVGSGVNRPLSHRRAGGSVVFAFPVASELVHAYFDAMTQQLVAGFNLERAVVIVNHPGQLAHSLSDEMPDGEPFIVAFEGDATFHYWFGELTEGRL